MVDIKLEGKEIAKSVCDLFSPLTELSGAIGDHIRIYRKLSVLKTLKRAEEKAKKEHIKLDTPPLKFLIPFIENASLEEEDSSLIDLWAKLLVSSSTEFKAEHNLFIRILNELSPNEAKAFNYIAKSHIHDSFKGHESHYEDVESDWDDTFAYIKIKDLLSKQKEKDLHKINYSDFERQLKEGYQQPGVVIYFFYVCTGKEKEYYTESLYDSPRTDFDNLFEPVSLSMLVSFGLIRKFESPEYWFDDIGISIYVYTLTPLGSSFYYSCVGDE